MVSLEGDLSLIAQALETTDIPFMLVNVNGDPIVYNKSMRALARGLPPCSTGIEDWAEHYKMYQMDGKTLMQVEEMPLARALQGEESPVVKFCVRDPRIGDENENLLYFQIHAWPIRSEQGDIIGAACSGREITEELRSKDLLGESLELRRSLISGMADIMVVVTDIDARIENVFNPVGDPRAESESSGVSVFDFLPPSSHATVIKTLSEVQKTKEARSYEEQGYAPGSEIGWYKVNVSPIIRKGVVDGFTFVCRDVSEYHRLVKKAEDANKAKDEFLASVSHELRTPLAAIIGLAEMMQQESLLNNGRADDRNEGILRHGKHLSRLLDDVLSLPKIEEGKLRIQLQPMNLEEEVSLALESFHQQLDEKGLEIKTSIDEIEDSFVVSDPTRIRQVVINLVRNSIKFSESGIIEVRVRKKANVIEIEVQDEGIGIPLVESYRIFQPFVSLSTGQLDKHGGSGLGLHISRRIARLLGGDLELIDSKPNGGSLFRFTIPCKSAQWEEEEKAPVNGAVPELSEQQSVLGGRKILVAEDCDDIRAIVKHYLESSGASVMTAENGVEAVELAIKGEPDTILMDIQMPELDGYAATEKLRSNGFVRPIIALTAHALDSEHRKCLAAGCSDVLRKPITRKELISALDRSGHALH